MPAGVPPWASCTWRCTGVRMSASCASRGHSVRTSPPTSPPSSILRAGRARTVVVDASLLGEVDEWGVAWLTRLRDSVRRLGGRVLVYGASGQVAEAVDGASLRP